MAKSDTEGPTSSESDDESRITGATAPATTSRAATMCGIATTVVGLATLAGWVLDLPWLKGGPSGLIEIKANASIGLILCGGSLVMQARGRRAWAEAAAVAAAALGLATLLECFLGVDLGIDELIFADRLSRPRFGLPPGRMAMAAATGLVLIASATVLAGRRPGSVVAQGLAFASVPLSSFSLLGYLFQDSRITAPNPYASLSVYTIAGFVTAASGVLALCTSRGPMSVFVGPGAGGKVLRRILPASVATILAIDWLGLMGIRAGWYRAEVGMAAFALIAALAMAAVLWVIATVLERSERAEAERRRAERQFRKLAESNVIGMVEVDFHGGIHAANDEYLRIIGFTREEFRSGAIDWVRLTPAERLAADDRGIAEARARGSCTPYETQYVRRDGVRVDVLVGLVMTDASRDQAQAFVLDITERKRAEDAIRVGQDRFRAIFETTAVGVAVADFEGRFLRANRAFCAIAGRTEAELLATDMAAITHPDDLPRKRVLFDRVVAGEVPSYEIEKRYVLPDGGIAWVLNSVTLLRDPEGRPESLIALTQDVTARKAAEDLVRRSEARYRALIEGLPQLVWSTTPEGACDFLSPQWIAFTGVPESDQLGFGWLDVIHPDDRERTISAWRSAVEGRSDYDVQYRIRSAEGSYRWFKVRGIPIRDDGRVARWFGTCTDIDDEIAAEDALREQDRRKDEFLAMLAHELRNPLAAIHGALRLGREDQGTLDWSHEVIDRQTRHLGHLIDDLLDVSRISRGMIPLRLERVDLRSILARAADSVRPQMLAKGHEFTIDTGDRPIPITADPTRIEQVVSNLLVNAAKYTDERGYIRLSADLDGDQAVVTVRDDGMGISAEILPHIFEPFTQGDRSIDRTEGGLGIGLTLVKRLVEMHGGTVSAASDAGGSTFTVRLPAASAETGPSRPADARAKLPESRGRRILAVDDNVDSALALSRLLKICGHDVYTAFDGLAALDQAGKLSPEVVLLDIGLPGMDGYEVARRLRADPSSSRVQIIAISGYGQDQDRIRSRQAGFDHHLVKPVDVDTLLGLIDDGSASSQ